MAASTSAPNLRASDAQQAYRLKVQREEFELSSSLLHKHNPLLYNLVAQNEDYSAVGTMSKSTSSPTLRRLGMKRPELAEGNSELEVYVALRNFQEFGGGVFHRLPAPLRDGLRDCGVCHYMTVFKQKDGTMVQFDFGPRAGGDIHVSSPGPLHQLARLVLPGMDKNENENENKNENSSKNRKKVDGQVRERRLERLPDSHMFVGTTNMSLADIRAWNMVHAAPEYELHRSDCRHYTDALVRYTTGIERAAFSALRHQLVRGVDGDGDGDGAGPAGSFGSASSSSSSSSSSSRSSRSSSAARAPASSPAGMLGRQLIRWGQYFTDAANWDRLCAIGNATTAAILTLGGQQTLARVGAVPLLQSVGAYSARLIPASARNALVPVKTYSAKLFQRPVYAMSTAAVASVATNNEVASGVRVGRVVTPAVMVRSAVDRGVQTVSRAVGAVRENVRVTQQRVASSLMKTRKKGVRGSPEVAAGGSSKAPAVPSSPQKPRSMFAFNRAPGAEGQPLSIGPGRGISGAAIQQLALIATRR